MKLGEHAIATIFEAYIGAINLEHGAWYARTWLLKLFRTCPAPEGVKLVPAENKFAELQQLATKRGLILKSVEGWASDSQEDGWRVALHGNGVLYGTFLLLNYLSSW